MDRFIGALREINDVLDTHSDQFTDEQLKDVTRLAREVVARSVAIRLKRAKGEQ
jgi:hypothetical protein